jgi:hypothetical protein
MLLIRDVRRVLRTNLDSPRPSYVSFKISNFLLQLGKTIWSILQFKHDTMYTRRSAKRQSHPLTKCLIFQELLRALLLHHDYAALD